ncbi:hypothetical protein DTO271D3_8725 [Paecilomyces variotii]|nr:hypothetical protein DTO169C6_6302 [Paecilomyces variotii]KAJ9249877.1 hypothetical protein DTO195F2_8359 [Paecilomyces variotii]KAJ9310213.1 hypothetical protein DTO217A2_499 [Paecilomyces variotii]KAJ9310995.1 hypothetical protein DTO271D3_8725 [Paecilomyces variotii]KAJ9368407.1 hypothetical protein DTO282E5_6875 [Paecilomyces variotii]
MPTRVFGGSFARETWALYGVGMLGVVLRFVARIKRLGIRNLQADDYLMMFAVFWYTLLCVALNEVASGGGSNLMTPEEIATMTPKIHADRVTGSKWVFVSEHSMVLTIWSLKACMLIIYARITEGLRQRRLINYCAIYVGLGFVGTELALFLTCRPLSDYWAVPTPNYQCSSYQHYEIIQGVFSISADLLMLCVAIPLLMSVRLPLKQKLILLLLFGMGAFVIVAAILTKVYCLVPWLINYVYMNWYFREATVAILVTNIPLIWSLLRDIFPALKSWTGGSRRLTERYRSGAYTKSSVFRKYGTPSGVQSSEFSMRSMRDFERVGSSPLKEVSDVSIRQSEEREAVSDDGSARALRIRQDITVTVQHDHREIEPEHQQNWPLGQTHEALAVAAPEP